MRWTGLSFYSSSAWSVVWRTLSHRLSQSAQSRAEAGRSWDVTTSCYSGYSRGRYCYPLWEGGPCGPSYCVVEGPEGASCIDPSSGRFPEPDLILIHDSWWESCDCTWRGSPGEGRQGAWFGVETHCCMETGRMGQGLWRAGWVRSHSNTAPDVAACPLALELRDLLLP